MDIVERLRICAKYDPDQAEAADEIERLREALRFISNINYGNGPDVTMEHQGVGVTSTWRRQMMDEDLDIIELLENLAVKGQQLSIIESAVDEIYGLRMQEDILTTEVERLREVIANMTELSNNLFCIGFTALGKDE
jgi:hypothetical protein